jgi:hypothetical protein
VARGYSGCDDDLRGMETYVEESQCHIVGTASQTSLINRTHSSYLYFQKLMTVVQSALLLRSAVQFIHNLNTDKRRHIHIHSIETIP